MEAWQLIATILGSSLLVEIVKLVVNRLQRKDTVEDKRAEAVAKEEDKRKDAAAQIEELRTETGEQFRQVDERMTDIEGKISTINTKTDNLVRSNKAQAYDRIRHLALTYIREGKISAGDLQNLGEMHEAYQLLGGDGFLDRLMLEVNERCRIIPDD